MNFEAVKDTDKWFPVRLVDSTDHATPEPSKVFGDITCKYGFEAATSESTHTVTTNEWKEQGDGNYWLGIGASEFTSEGKYIVKIECAGCDDYNFVVEVKDKTFAALIDDVGTLLTRVPAEVAQKAHLVNGTGDITPSANKGIWDSLGDGTKSISGLQDLPAGAQMDLVNSPNATAIDKWWDEPLIGHAIEGSAGKVLLDAGTNALALVNRLGAFTGSGVNTVLGFLRAMMRKDVGITTPSDVGGTYAHADHSQEATVDRGDAAWTTGSITVTPVCSTVSAGAVSTNKLEAEQYTAFGPYVFEIVDSDESPVDLSGKTVKFVAYDLGDPDTVLWKVEGSVSGVNNNYVTVSDTDTNMQSRAVLGYRLENTTDDKVVNKGTLTIEPGPDESA